MRGYPKILVPSVVRRACLQANTETENWCGVLQEVVLPGLGSDPAAFLDSAVTFCNEKYVLASISLQKNLYLLKANKILVSFFVSQNVMHGG